MYEDNKEDILCSRVNYTVLSLISPKINVLIVGGGKAALTKVKTFVKNGCRVSVLSKEHTAEFNELINHENLELIKGEYKQDYILNKHMVIIATNSENTNERIREDCNRLYKLYIDCSKPKEGLCVTACQRSTKSTTFGINIRDFSPKTSVFLADKIKKELEMCDDFIEFTAFVRNNIKQLENKNEIMDFICSDDFMFFYEKNMNSIVLKMFYPEIKLSIGKEIKRWD